MDMRSEVMGFELCGSGANKRDLSGSVVNIQ